MAPLENFEEKKKDIYGLKALHFLKWGPKRVALFELINYFIFFNLVYKFYGHGIAKLCVLYLYIYINHHSRRLLEMSTKWVWSLCIGSRMFFNVIYLPFFFNYYFFFFLFLFPPVEENWELWVANIPRWYVALSVNAEAEVVLQQI